MPSQLHLIHQADNVLVIVGDLSNGIPIGHKVARRAIRRGEPVIKYGDPIGVAVCDIAAGEWIHTHNIRTNLSDDCRFTAFPAGRTSVAAAPAGAGPARRLFSGFRRSDGRAGIRNEIWIIPTVGCVNQTTVKLARYGQEQVATGRWPGVDGAYCYTHPYGCSQLGDDHERTRHVLAGLIRHPNAGAALIVGLGCENNQAADLVTELGDYDPDRYAVLVTQDAGDELAEGRRLLDRLAAQAGQAIREPCPLADLVVGLKCGGSDAFSGLTANPLAGRFTDRLTAAGGSAILSEIPEMFGAEHLLLGRTADQDVYSRLAGLFVDFRAYYSKNGLPVYENPSPGNKAGGISTLEEKSLGCTQKGGSALVADVLRYGERLRKPGLTILEGPGNDLIACTALAAAGAQLILFTTGRGTPLGGPVPTLKIASNTPLAELKPHWIDLDAGPVLLHPDVGDRLDRRLDELVLATAEGRIRTRNELADYREIALFKNGVIL